MANQRFSSHVRRRTTGLAAILSASLGMSVAANAQSFGSATFSAYVASTGGILRSSGVASSARNGTGIYTITFTRSLAACVYTITGVANTPTQATGLVNDATPNVLSVRIFNGTGTPTNTRFNVIVVCGP